VVLSRLNVVGCGRLGRAISKLFLDAGVVSDVHVANRSLDSGQAAVRAIGGGKAHVRIADMPSSSLWLVACGDQAIGEVVEALTREASLSSSSVVFHCSGILSSAELAPLRERGCGVASVHPVRSFANTEMAVRDFAGTFCGIEGDESAQAILKEIFFRVGGKVFSIPTETKLLCHGGHVFASNYLVALLKVARDLYVSAGIPEEIAWQLMEPLVRGTVDNVMRLGPAGALTGPIARGEGDIVAQQRDVIARASAPCAELYAQLGLLALDIAREQGLSDEGCRSIRAAFRING
jgi:predicted short-subunit dehydrogenase-like oxidoreductase (DUF2520 family)